MTTEREYYVEVGQRIKRARNLAKLTQQDLADEVELSRTSITNIENGNQPVTMWLMHQLAAALNRDAMELFPVKDASERSDFPADVPPQTVAVLRRLAQR